MLHADLDNTVSHENIGEEANLILCHASTSPHVLADRADETDRKGEIRRGGWLRKWGED